MKLFKKGKDGGPYSHVTGYWLIEWKRFFSVALLRFDDGSRESFHSHAFGAVSFLLKGYLREQILLAECIDRAPGPKPIVTRRSTFHRVTSIGTSWALTFRGPWAKDWREYDPQAGRFINLTAGRKEVP